jgi:Gram-negative bacterial TonB protein C-terminal
MAAQLTLPPDISGEGLSPNDELVFGSQFRAPLVIPKALLAELANNVTEAIRAVPRGGAEIGGLLVASSTRSGFVRVRQILPVAIEYRFGPGFRPSPDDIVAFQRAASSVQADPTKTVVGFYRNATRDPKYLRDTDHQILAALEQVHRSYARDFRFVMIVTSVSKTSLLAEVATCEAGVWQQWQPHTLHLPLLPGKPMLETSTPETKPMLESSTPETQRDSSSSAEPVTRPLRSLAGALRIAEMERLIETQPGSAPPDAPAASSTTVASPVSERPGARPARFLRLAPVPYLAMALFLVLGLSGLYYGFDARRKLVRPPAAPAPARMSRMGFAANPEGGIWKLTWNRDAVTALNPSSASLSIRDGANQQQIPLTAAELGAGMVFYTPQSGDLVFGLKVLLSGAPPEEEEVRVLQAIRPPQTPAQPSVQIVANDHRIRTVRPFMPPPQVQQQTRHDLVEPAIPPAIMAENKLPAAPEIPALVIPSVHTTVPYVRSQVSQNLSMAPPASSAEPKPSATITPSYVPPKPVRRTNARLPVGTLIGNPVDVEVKVQIDAAGKVTKAAPVKVNAINYALVNPAVHAAESWGFDPALENGRPVPSEMIVTFRFTSK